MLESRRLLAAAPLAGDDSLIAFENRPLKIVAQPTFLHLHGDPQMVEGGDVVITPGHAGLHSEHGLNVISFVGEVLPFPQGMAYTLWMQAGTMDGVLQTGTYVDSNGDNDTFPKIFITHGSSLPNPFSRTGQFTILQYDLGTMPGDEWLPDVVVDFVYTENNDPAMTISGRIAYHQYPGLLGNDVFSAPEELVASIVTAPVHGTIAEPVPGTFVYTPAANFVGTDSFAYALTDSNGTGAPAVVMLNVSEVNQAPSFVKGPDVAADEDSGFATVSGWASEILAGPPQEHGQRLQFVVTSNSNPGLFTNAPAIDPLTGTLTFKSAPNANGSATVTVMLKDDGGVANGGIDTSLVQTFAIVLNGVPDAPVAMDDAFDHDGLNLINRNGHAGGSVFANDLSLDEAPMSARVAASPAHGTVTFNADGTFAYAPAASFFGTDSFTYVATASGLDSAPATVTIDVRRPTPTQLPTNRVFDVLVPPTDPKSTTPAVVPLSNWRVYDDVNGDGVWQASEPSAVTSGGQYNLSLSPGRHTVRLVQKPGWGPVPGYGDFAVVDVVAGAAPVIPVLMTTMTAPTVVDVNVYYTSSAATQYPSIERALIDLFVMANEPFANSDTNVLIDVRGIESAGYAGSGNVTTDLLRLTNPRDHVMDGVLGARDRTGADLVFLFTGPSKTNSRELGVADTLDPRRPRSDRPFGVVSVRGDVGDDAQILAHELGHALSAGHDVPNERPGKFPAFAHGASFQASDGLVYQDVMSYGDGRVLPFFSTPGVFFKGHALGEPKLRDNARAIRENAPIVASYRDRRSPGDPVAVTKAVTVTKKPIRAGTRVSAMAKVANVLPNTLDASGSVRFYLSNDGSLDDSDVLLKSVPVALKLRAGASRPVAAVFQVPSAAVAGTYTLIAVVEAGVASASHATGPVSMTPLVVAAAAVRRR